jgi:hypothetical protein
MTVAASAPEPAKPAQKAKAARANGSLGGPPRMLATRQELQFD